MLQIEFKAGSLINVSLNNSANNTFIDVLLLTLIKVYFLKLYITIDVSNYFINYLSNKLYFYF
jgi:hypothetical protein